MLIAKMKATGTQCSPPATLDQQGDARKGVDNDQRQSKEQAQVECCRLYV